MVFYYLIAAIVILLDQWTKALIVKNFTLGESIEIIPNVLYLTSHRNTGAAWGILAGQMWFSILLQR